MTIKSLFKSFKNKKMKFEKKINRLNYLRLNLMKNNRECLTIRKI